MVLVDTSVWIDFFRGLDSPEAEWLTTALARDESLCTCGPILAEILQGAASHAESRKLKRHFSPFVYLPTQRETYYLAADVYRAARAKGKIIRNTVDCLIAACAIENSVSLLQRDKDFTVIAGVSKLRIVAAK